MDFSSTLDTDYRITSLEPIIESRISWSIVMLVWKNSQCLAVLDDAIIDLIHGVVLEHKPFPHQLRRRQPHSRLLQEVIVVVGAA